MNGDEILKFVLNFLSNVAIWIILIFVAIFMYLFFNKEIYEKLMAFIAPILVYALAIFLVILWRKRKNDNLVRGGSEMGSTIYVTQWDLLKHDLVMFVTPLVMILIAKFFKKEVDGFDIFLSAIACLGLYASELIYKQKMK